MEKFFISCLRCSRCRRRFSRRVYATDVVAAQDVVVAEANS
jgi:hypothetical protein